jgi:hypothetical protein
MLDSVVTSEFIKHLFTAHTHSTVANRHNKLIRLSAYVCAVGYDYCVIYSL